MIVAVTAAAAFSSTMGVLRFQASSRVIEAEHDKRQASVVRASSETLADLVLTSDAARLTDRLHQIRSAEPGISYAFVVGLDGRPLASTLSGGPSTQLLRLNPAAAAPEVTRRQFATPREDIEDVSLRLFEGLPAELHIGFSLSDVQRALGANLRLSVASGLALMVLAAALTYLLERVLVIGPLERLTAAVARYADTGSYEPPGLRTKDEIGALGAAFETLSLQLERRIAELEAAHQTSRALARKVIAAQEEERARVAADVHDGLLQSLVSMHYWLEGQHIADSASDPETRERLLGFSRMIEAAASTGRRLVARLRPPLLDVLGLTAAVHEFATEAAKQAGVLCVVQADDLPPLEDGLATGAYRIIQEAVVNALKHSSPAVVEVTIACRDDRLAIRVRDDGEGFSELPDPAKRAAEGHVGLQAMVERVQTLGGTFSIESEPGRGTLVMVDLPLATKTRDHEAERTTSEDRVERAPEAEGA